MPTWRAALLVSTLALGACAAPSSFDGITGGAPESPAPVATTPAPAPTSSGKATLKEDATVKAPRPISPISVSFISSKRPRLRWDLGLEGKLTGAVVEMARTRDFAKNVKTFQAKGSELAVPQDLDLGVWFWRLKGATTSAYGTTTSPTWEMVVRGPAAHGSSDMPTRSMVDYNGDGEPDLLVSGTGVDTIALPTDTLTYLLFYAGAPDRFFADGPENGGYWDPHGAAYEGPVQIGGGTDFNGDGYTDVIESGVAADVDDQGKRFFCPSLIYSLGPASSARDGSIDWTQWQTMSIGPTSALPSVREAADVDGDGYGDALIGVPSTSYMVIGAALKPLSAQGEIGPPPALLPLFPDFAIATSTGTTSRIAMGGFDVNGDGLADVVFSMSNPSQPSMGALAAAGDHAYRVGDPKPLDAPIDATIPATLSSLATAFAAGDFNGDGIDDLAVTMPTSDSTRVCLWYGSRDKLVVPGPCVAAPAGDTEFGASLTAADLEGDGVDELLVTAKATDVAGVRVVRIAASGTASVAPIGIPGLGVRLTTIWPGRPGKARWAAVAADGSRVGVFEGADLKANVMPPSPSDPQAYGQGIIRGFGRGLR